MAEEEMGERRTRRVPTHCRVFFFGDEDFEGEAQLLECSTTGCRMSTELEVSVGQEFRLSLFLSDLPWPVRIEMAVVRWTKGSEFGVEFMAIRSSVKERIRLLLIKTRDYPTVSS